MFTSVNLVAKQLINIFKNSKIKVGIINIIFIFLLFFSPSDKFIFLISIFHLLVMLLITKSALEALVNVYWPWIVFEYGREFSTILIPLQHIRSDAYHSPVVLNVLFSPASILILFLIIYVIYNIIHNPRPRFIFSEKWFVLFIIYFAARLISVALTEFNDTFSLVSLLKSDGSFFWLLAVLQLQHSVRRSVFRSLLITFGCLFLLEIGLAVFQLLKGGFIGIHAEKAWYVASYGKGADENVGLVRVSGFQYHPNGMANSLFGELVAVLLLIQVSVKKVTRKMNFSILTIGMLSIALLSLTRTILLTMGIIPFLYWNELKSLLHDCMEKPFKHSRMIRFALVGVLLVVATIVGYRLKDRILLSIYSTRENGGIATRILQYQEAIGLIQKKPLFGHGVGMYQAALYNWIPSGEVLYFPERVHNSFLLIAAESGIPSLLIALLLLLAVILKGYRLLDKQLIVVWFFYGMLYLFLQPVSHELLALPNIIIVLLSTYYEKTSTP